MNDVKHKTDMHAGEKPVVVAWSAKRGVARIPKKQLKVVGVAALILCMAGVFAVLVVVSGRSKTDGSATQSRKSGTLSQSTQQDGVIPIPSDAIDAAYQKADSLQFKGDYGEAKKTMDDAIKKTNSDQEKAKGYSAFAAIATNQKSYKDALDYALKADAIYKTASSAALVAQSAASNGDKATAIQYYGTAISLMHPAAGDENAQAQLDEYTSGLAELKR